MNRNCCKVEVAMLLFCLAATAFAQQAMAPPSPDAPEDIVVLGERERQRKSTPPVDLTNPDVITLTRAGDTRMRLKTVRPAREILFRRESIARQLPADSINQPVLLQRDRLAAEGKAPIEDVTLEFAADIEEADGLPAVISFGPGLSIVNIDYVRLLGTGRQTLINVANALHPQTRSCEAQLRLADDAMDFRNRFILLADRLEDCVRIVRNREGDLHFAEGVPETLRQELSAIYGSVSNRFSLKLGSEPGMLFVAWQPDDSRSNLRFEYSWSRNSLLMFNGPAWQRELAPQQRDALWEGFAREQILRRLQWQGRPDAFTLSAANYLLLLARAERDHTTTRMLSTELPSWIAACAGDLGSQVVAAKTLPEGVSSIACGHVLQFVYDAIARAKSKGGDTVNRTWRKLLTESYRRGRSGVEPGAFMNSSGDAQRIVQGLLKGSTDWSQFVDALNTQGVRLRIKPDQSRLAVEVLSLEYFRN
jgi:hypothetical protein